jgi:predicted transcriptional regulator
VLNNLKWPPSLKERLNELMNWQNNKEFSKRVSISISRLNRILESDYDFSFNDIRKIPGKLDLIPVGLFRILDGKLEDLGVREFRHGKNKPYYLANVITKYFREMGLTPGQFQRNYHVKTGTLMEVLGGEVHPEKQY